MPLPVPQLDDRRFQDIVDEAKKRIARPENQVNFFNYMDRRVHRKR